MLFRKSRKRKRREGRASNPRPCRTRLMSCEKKDQNHWLGKHRVAPAERKVGLFPAIDRNFPYADIQVQKLVNDFPSPPNYRALGGEDDVIPLAGSRGVDVQSVKCADRVPGTHGRFVAASVAARY